MLANGRNPCTIEPTELSYSFNIVKVKPLKPEHRSKPFVFFFRAQVINGDNILLFVFLLYSLFVSNHFEFILKKVNIILSTDSKETFYMTYKERLVNRVRATVCHM